MHIKVVSKVVLLAEEVKKGKGQWKFQGWCFWSPSSYIYTNGFTLETGRNTHGVQIKSIYILYTSKNKNKNKKTNTDAYRMVESKSDSLGSFK